MHAQISSARVLAASSWPGVPATRLRLGYPVSCARLSLSAPLLLPDPRLQIAAPGAKPLFAVQKLSARDETGAVPAVGWAASAVLLIAHGGRHWSVSVPLLPSTPPRGDDAAQRSLGHLLSLLRQRWSLPQQIPGEPARRQAPGTMPTNGACSMAPALLNDWQFRWRSHLHTSSVSSHMPVSAAGWRFQLSFHPQGA